MARIIATFIPLLLAFTLAACGGASPTAQSPAATSPSQEQPTPVPATADTAVDVNDSASESTSEEAATTGTYPAIFEDPNNLTLLLDSLQSYRLKMDTMIKTTSGEQITEDTAYYLEERIADPVTLRVVVSNNNDSGENETQIHGNTLYQIRNTAEGQNCETTVLADQQMTQTSIEMARSMSGIMGLSLALAMSPPTLVSRGEEINGVVADYYQVRFSQSGIEINGDFWVAPEGYLVHAAVAQKTGDALESLHNYSLEAINQIDTINAPSTCQAASEMASSNIPTPDDAQITLANDEMLSFNTGLGLKEVADFYREQLAAGYSVETLSENDASAILEATNDSQRLQIHIGAGNESTTAVMISINR